MLNLSAKVTGGREITAKLAELEKKVRTKATKAAVTAGTRVFVQGLKAAAPKETGTLIKALGQREKVYKGGQIAFGVAGARKGQQRVITRKVSKRGKVSIKSRKIGKGEDIKGRAGIVELRNPAKIAHLTEGGRKAITAKKGKAIPVDIGGGLTVFRKKAKAVPAKRWMAKAFQAKAAAAQAAAIESLKSSVGL